MSTQATPDLEGYEEFVAFMLDGLTPEEKMMGLKPEQRLAGLAPEEKMMGLKPEQRLAGLAPEEKMMGLEPEQRLAGLAPEHVALALPVEVLRALSADYIATLPDDVQREVRARLSR